MRILLSAYYVDPTRSSEWATSWTWLVDHARLGNQITCLTSCWDDDNRRNIEQGLADLGLDNVRMEYVELPSPLRNWRRARSTVGVYFRYLLWQSVAAAYAARLDRRLDFDLVHHVSWGSMQMATGTWRLGKPLLFGPAGGGQFPPQAFRKYFGSGWRKEQFREVVSWMLCRWKKDFRQVINRADHILVVNPETKALAEQGKAPVELTLQAPLAASDLPPICPVHKEGPELRLLWVGRLMARKGVPLVLEALSHLRDLPCRLTIIGDDSYGGPRMAGWLKQYGVEDRVDWRGMQTFDQVKQAYLDHDVFLFATLRDSCAGQLAEAMAYAVPVVTLDLHGGSTLVPDQAGIKVPATKPAETALALADAVRRLAADPALRRQMGEYGYSFVRDEILPWRRQFLQRYLAKFLPAAAEANEPALV